MASKLPSRRAGHRSLRVATLSTRRYRPSLESIEQRLLLSTYTVNAMTDTGSGSGTSGDLRYAITQANDNPGSTIDITASGTDTLTTSLPDLAADTTITDSDPGSFIVQGGGTLSDFNALTINAGVTATISGLDFTNFANIGFNGGIFDVEGSLTLNNSGLKGQSSANQGGAVYVGYTGVLDANQTIFHDNSATNGGAIENENSVTLSGGSVLNNTADEGGGVEADGYLYADGEEFYGNSATSTTGGAINYNAGFGMVAPYLLVANSTIDGNTATTDGGGIMSYYSAKFRDDTIANNTSGSGATGAGIYNANPTVTPGFYNSIVAQNMAGSVEDDIDGVDGLYAASSYNLIGYTSFEGITNGSQGNQIGTSDTPLQADLAARADNGGTSDTLALNPGSPALGTGLVANAIDLVTLDPLLYDQRGVGFPRVVNNSIDIGAYQTELPATSLDVTDASGTYGGTTTLTAQLTSDDTDVADEMVDFHIGSTDLGDATTNSSGVAELTNVSLASINVGTFTGDVTASFAGDSSYAATNGSADLTVSPAALTITANDGTKTYGSTKTFAGTEFTTSTLFNGDTVTSATLTSAGAAATATVAGSPYAIIPSAAVGTGLSNYFITYDTGNLTVNTAPLTITANSTTKTYGQTTTFLGTEFTTSTLYNDDSVTSVTLTSPGAVPTAVVAGSTYAINPSAAVGTGLSNYTITYDTGNLTVDAATLTITANDTTKTYGDTTTFAGTEFTTTGLVNDDSVASVTLTSPGAAPTAVVAGSTYAINPSAAVGTGLSNYSIIYNPGNLTVDAAPLTITANPTSKTYGATTFFAGTEFTTTGLVNSDSVTSVTLTSLGAAPTATVAGSPYLITPSAAVGTGLSNYTITYDTTATSPSTPLRSPSPPTPPPRPTARRRPSLAPSSPPPRSTTTTRSPASP